MMDDSPWSVRIGLDVLSFYLSGRTLTASGVGGTE